MNLKMYWTAKLCGIYAKLGYANFQSVIQKQEVKINEVGAASFEK